MKRTRALAPLIALLVLAGTGAAAETLAQGPEREPRTEGPLTLDTRQCSEEPIKSDDGELLGNAEVCIFLYSFDTLAETDVLREYGAAWQQTTFTPAKGWCATEIGTKLSLNGGISEGTSKVAGSGRKAITRLDVTAGGNALEDGRISQTGSQVSAQQAVPQSSGARPSVATDWKGKSSKTVSLISGVAYSYSLIEGAPDKVSYGFSDFALISC